MKKILFLIIALNVSLVFSQNLRVIKVDGTILLKKNNTVITKGSVLSPDDEIIFKSPNARAAVIIPGKGRYVLQNEQTNSSFTKAYLAPAMSNISSRSAALNNLTALKEYFDGKYVIIDNIKIKVPKDKFPMDENSFFYIKYKYKGETVNKKLKHIDDTLIINRKDLLTVDKKPIPNPYISNMELIYLKKDNDNIKNIFINEFSPVFPKPEELKEEVSIILESMKEKSRQEKINEVFSFINDFYGKPDKENLEKWLSKEFGL